MGSAGFEPDDAWTFMSPAKGAGGEVCRRQ